MRKLLTTLIAAAFAVTTTGAFAQAPAPSGDAPKTEKKAEKKSSTKHKSSSKSKSKTKSADKPAEDKK